MALQLAAAVAEAVTQRQGVLSGCQHVRGVRLLMALQLAAAVAEAVT